MSQVRSYILSPQVLSNSSLVIEKVRLKDSGVYKVLATNDAGIAEFFMMLIVGKNRRLKLFINYTTHKDSVTLSIPLYCAYSHRYIESCELQNLQKIRHTECTILRTMSPHYNLAITSL